MQFNYLNLNYERESNYKITQKLKQWSELNSQSLSIESMFNN